MFQLKARDEYRKTNFFINFFILILLIPLTLTWAIITFTFLGNQNIINEELFKKVNVISFFSFIGIGFLFTITNIIIKKKYLKKIVKEHLEITSKVKMPKDLPKVVYVYTTHNDFMPSRMLQNMQQTYPNMEYWISDGSSNEDVSKEVKEFAQKHNVNLFKMDRPSKNKSDNLNTFLKSLYDMNHDFQYIVTSDSDVAFDKRFIETAIKYFYSDRLNSIGYVNSLLMDYKGISIYNHAMAGFENRMIYDSIVESLDSLKVPHLYGACSITKREFLKDINNGYFCDLYEDWYTRMNGIKDMWRGVYTPLVISQQSMEESVFSTLNRYMRYFDWQAKFFKKNTFYKFNDEYAKSFWEEHNNVILYLPKLIFKLLILAFLIFMLVGSWKSIFLFLPLSLLLVNKIGKAIEPIKFLGFKQSLLMFFISPIWSIALSFKKFEHWFKSVLRNQIIEFKPTRSREKNEKKETLWHKNKKNIYLFLVFLTIFVFLNLLIFVFFNEFWFNKQEWWWLQFLSIFSYCFTLYLLLGNLFTTILFIFSFIKINKRYSPDDFIEFDKNGYINWFEIKNNFFNENKNIERFC